MTRCAPGTLKNQTKPNSENASLRLAKFTVSTVYAVIAVQPEVSPEKNETKPNS
jgi:hypothetical protein